MMNLKDKYAVIVGAGGAMGSRIVRHLKKEGTNLILIEERKSLLETVSDLLDGDRTTVYECDMSDLNKVEEIGDRISSKFSKIDILVNAAGIGVYKDLKDLTISDWEKTINVNLNSPFVFIKKLIHSLESSGNGTIINFGSGMGVIAKAGRSAYCTSKFAMRGMTLSLAKEYNDKGVKFVLLTLGSIMTNFGTGGLEKRKELEANGKKYLDPDTLAQNIVDIIKNDNKQEEYVIYPEGYEKE